MISGCTCLCAKRPLVNAEANYSLRAGNICKHCKLLIARHSRLPQERETFCEILQLDQLDHIPLKNRRGHVQPALLNMEDSGWLSSWCAAIRFGTDCLLCCQRRLQNRPETCVAPTARRKRSWWPSKMPFGCLATVPVRSNLLWEPGVAAVLFRQLTILSKWSSVLWPLCILLRANEMAGPSFLGNLQRSTWSTLVVSLGHTTHILAGISSVGSLLQPHAGWKAWWNYHIQQKRKLQADLFFNDWDRLTCQLIWLPSDHPSTLSEDCSWTQMHQELTILPRISEIG